MEVPRSVWRLWTLLTACIILQTAANHNGVAPQIVQPPRSVVVMEGREAELNCKATGTPPPKVHWKRNNHTLKWLHSCTEEMVRMCIKEDGTLIIQNAMVADSGRFRCLVRNHAGREESETVWVEVQHKDAQPPQFLDGGPQDEREMIGETVTLRCQAAGSGEIRVWWTKLSGDKLLPEDRHSQLDDNSLEIRVLQSSDAGGYACTAENKYGWVMKTIYLSVMAHHGHATQQPPLTDPPLQFNVLPEDQHVYVGDTAMFDCDVQGPFGTVLLWYKGKKENGEIKIDGSTIGRAGDVVSPDKRFDIFANGTLAIANVTMQYAGPYVCQGYSDEGIITTPATLTVTELPTPTQRVPVYPTVATDSVTPSVVPITGGPNQVPTGVQAVAESATSVRVTWGYPDLSSNRRPTSYIISYDFASNAQGAKTQTVEGTKTLSHDVVGLRPYTEYHIRVIPYNVAGTGSSSTGVVVTTLPARPGVIDPDGARVTVANVRVSVLDDRGTVKVVWDPLSPDVTNGDLLGYKVAYSCGKDQPTTIIVDREQNSKQVQLKPGDNCSVSVWAYNGVGEGEPSPSYRFTVEEEPPRSEPFTQSIYFIIIVTVVAITIIVLTIMVTICVVHKRRSGSMDVSKDIGQRPDPTGARTSAAYDMEEMSFHEDMNMASTPKQGSHSRTPRGYFPAPPARAAPMPSLMMSSSLQQSIGGSTPVTTELYLDSKGSASELDYEYAANGPHLGDNAPPIPNRRPVFRPGYRTSSADLPQGMMAYATDGHIEDSSFDFDPSDSTRQSIRSYEYGKGDGNGRPASSRGKERNIPSKMNNSSLASRNLDVRVMGRQSQL